MAAGDEQAHTSLTYAGSRPKSAELECRRDTAGGTVTLHFFKVTAMKLGSLVVR